MARAPGTTARYVPPRPAPSGAGVRVLTIKGRTPEAALGVTPQLPPNQAPYKPGLAPSQVATKALNTDRAVTGRSAVDPRVVQIQTHLKQLGYNVEADGIMGPITRAAMQVSQNGTQPNVVHHPDHAREQAARHVARAEVTRQVKARRSSHPFFEGQKPEGMVARPGGVMEPVYVSRHPGPTVQDPSLHLNPQDEAAATRMGIENQGGLFPYAVKTGLAALVPARSINAIGNGRAPSQGDIASDIFNGALWLTPGAVAPALRTARVAAQAFREEGITANAVRTIREARGAIKSAAEDKAAYVRAQKVARRAQALQGPVVSPVKDELAAALKATPKITPKQADAILHTNDLAARAVAHQLGTTPEHAYELLWKGAAFHDIAPTADSLHARSLAQMAREPEITNLAQVPEAVGKVESMPIQRAARNLTRTHKEAAPPHANTPKALNALLTDLQQRALEAADYRHWYANSAAGILAHVNGDTQAADQLAALIAVYSPRAEVYSKSTEWNNLDRAINAFDEYHATGEISPRWSISSHKTGEGDWQTYRAQQIMQGNFEWEGLKTNRFYRNFLQHIDPEKYKALFGDERFGTMDTWMRRAFGYPAAGPTEERATLFGTEHVPVGKKQEPITPRMYDFMEKATQAIADSLGWGPEEAQAAIWTSVKAEAEGTPLSQAGFDFRDAFLHREARRARPLKEEQLGLDVASADQPLQSAVDEAIDASRAPDSGFTLTAGLNPDTGRTGYAVSYGAYEYREAAPLTRRGLLDFRNKHLALLKSDPSLRVGGWHNPEDGQVYLDISRVFDSKDEALAFGREQGQLAIFDRENMDVVPTGLPPEQADTIKAGLVEAGRLREQAAKYDDVLEQVYSELSGKTVKGGLKADARKDAEDALWAFAERHPDAPWAQQFRDLYHDAQVARSAPNPELLFQDDELVNAIAAEQGKPINREDVMAKYAGRDLGLLPDGRRSNRNAQEIASRYMDERGAPYSPPTVYAKVEPERARRIADWYDQAVSAPDDPAVRSAYEAMARETLDQYNAIIREGYVFEFYPPGVDPYPSGPSAAIDDLRSNRHLYVFPTDEGFGSLSEAEAAHPLLQDSGVKWGDKPTTHNDIFRAVHDFMGHFKEGVGFRADGEENAWRAHSAMYSPEARRAMTSETRGQNSWVNYGPHGETNQTAKQGETVYADQKAVLAPDWVVHEGSGAPVVKGAVQRTPGGGSYLHLFQSADVSTAIHELGHAIEPLLPASARHTLAQAGLMDPEKFARTFEQYFREGGVPDPKLGKVFRTIAEGMAKVYGRAARVPGSAINPEIRKVFDEFFLREGARDPAWAARAASVFFQTDDQKTAMLEAAAMQHEQGGMDVETAAKMFGLDAPELQAHIDSGAHAAEQERILSNRQLDERYGAAETTKSAEDYLLQEEHDPIDFEGIREDLKRIYGGQTPREKAEAADLAANPEPEKAPWESDEEFNARLTAWEHGIDDTFPSDWLTQEEHDGFFPEGGAEPTAEELQQGLKGVRGAQHRQKNLRKADMQDRVRKVAEIQRSVDDPDEAAKLIADVMRGERPKVDFHGFDEFTEDALRHFKAHVNALEDGTLPLQKMRVNIALDNAYHHNKMPTPSELALIEHIFGTATARGFAQKALEDSSHWGRVALNILNIPRTMQSTLDASGLLRQNLVAVASHPMIARKAIPVMVKAMRDEKSFERSMQEIRNDPAYPLALAGGLKFTDIGEGASAAAHEEMFQSDYAARMLDMLPVPNVIKGSARGYVTIGNTMRMDIFKQQLRMRAAAGLDIHDEKFLKQISHVLNAATGRGAMPEAMEHIMPALNTFLYSPRLMLSRLNYLDPTWYVRLKGPARREALRGLFATAGMVTTAVALIAQIPGVDVGSLDPHSSDFGKIRFGNTHLDLAGGFLQYIHLAAELAPAPLGGYKISSTTGQKQPFGGGYGKQTRLDTLIKFMEGKAAPPVGATMGELNDQKDAVGDPITAKSFLTNYFIPLGLQDAKGLYNEKHGGVNGITWAMMGYGLSAIGEGVQNYAAKDPGVAKQKTLTQEAKDAGFPPPSKDILLALDHKANIDHIGATYETKQERLAATVKYYTEVTGKHDFDRVIESAKGNDALADQMLKVLRTVLVGPGLSAYEHAIETATNARKKG